MMREKKEEAMISMIVLIALVYCCLTAHSLIRTIPAERFCLRNTKRALAQKDIISIGVTAVSAQKLRDLSLIDAVGTTRKVSDISGSSKSIIIFLRYPRITKNKY